MWIGEVRNVGEKSASHCHPFYDGQGWAGDFHCIIKIKANFAACQGIQNWLGV